MKADSPRFLRQAKLVSRKSLLGKTIAIVGLGGLGCPAAEYLGAAGVGKILLVDRDVVGMSNLNRQFLYSERDASGEKAVVAKKALSKKYPDTEFVSVVGSVNDFSKFSPSVVLDCTDNLESRRGINSFFTRKKIPVVYGGAIGWTGAVSSFVPGGFCLECFLSGKGRDETCENAGIVGPVAGAIGCMQAIEALKILSGKGANPKGVRYFDFLSGENWLVPVKRNVKCPVCSGVWGKKK